MAILHQLGINYTTFYCLVIFITTFFILKALVFEPYYNALAEREKRTKGGEESAKAIQQQTQETKAIYEAEARDLNSQVKSIFDESRLLATKEYARAVNEARQNAEHYIEKVREQVGTEIKKASEQLKLEVPSVVQAITKKMLD
jgi:F0F1-type ATP synthase membrane subunit b/b'